MKYRLLDILFFLSTFLTLALYSWIFLWIGLILVIGRMDGGPWTPASRSRYNLRDTVARCTTQVCVMNFHIQNGVFRTQYSNTTIITMERGFKMNERNAKHSILNANPIGLKRLLIWGLTATCMLSVISFGQFIRNFASTLIWPPPMCSEIDTLYWAIKIRKIYFECLVGNFFWVFLWARLMEGEV